MANDGYPDFDVKRSGLIAQINVAILNVAAINGTNNFLSPSLLAVNNTANEMVGFANSIGSLYNISLSSLANFSSAASKNMSASVPKIKASVLSAIMVGGTSINTNLSCAPLSNDYIEARQGFCGGVVASMDSFWSTLLIMALISLLSLPTTIFVANTLVLDLERYRREQHPNLDPRSEGELMSEQPFIEKDVTRGDLLMDSNKVTTKLT